MKSASGKLLSTLLALTMVMMFGLLAIVPHTANAATISNQVFEKYVNDKNVQSPVGVPPGNTVNKPNTDQGNPPAKPTDLMITKSATIKTGHVLTWTDNSTDEDIFVIERKKNNEDWVVIKQVDANTTTYHDHTITNMDLYDVHAYRVQAVRFVNDYSLASEYAEITRHAYAPAWPSDLTATAGTTGIALKWTDNSVHETGYLIHRKEENTSGAELTTLPANSIAWGNPDYKPLKGYINLTTLPADSISYTDNTAAVGKTYHYVVQAVRYSDKDNITYISDPSNEASATIVGSATPPSPVPAPTPAPTGVVIVYTLDSTTYTVNGVVKNLDAAPVVLEGRTLLPIRSLVEPLGGTIDWDSTDSKITIQFQGTKIDLWIGQHLAAINGVSVPIDPDPNVVPLTINGRTMLPVRFIAENLGCDVKWNEATSEITVIYPKAQP